MGIVLFQAIIFLSAFLLFQIELIAAKFYLPVFGGEFWVWGACMVFFQATLLLGYAQAHFIFHRLGLRRYKWLHLCLLILPLFFFPGRLLSEPCIFNGMPVVLNVFVSLITTIGPVFFVLSTISILMQSWLVHSRLNGKFSPYALYAISNVGSFAALLTYPVLVQPFFDLIQEQRVWQVGYGLLLAAHILLYLFLPVDNNEAEVKVPLPSMERKEFFSLIFLGAAGCVMFLSVTNIVTAEIAPIPLFWVIPLFIYLLSFSLNFKKSPWCPAFIENRVDVILGLSAILYFLIIRKAFPFLVEAVLLAVALFLICMYCQRQLYLKRPQDPRAMTLFYVVFSLGSFLGGVFVSWIAPAVFDTLMEYLLGLLFLCFYLISVQGIKHLSLRQLRGLIYLLTVIIAWPLFFVEYHIGAIIFLIAFIMMISRFSYGIKNNATALCMVILIFCMSAQFADAIWKLQHQIGKIRNYYGLYSIEENQDAIYLSSYTTIHGAQFKARDKKDTPTLYYAPQTAVGAIFTSEAFDFKNVGVVGLGAGTLAAYSKPGQAFDFYELDPDVEMIARQHFSFLERAKGEVNVIIGDGRIALQSVPPGTYDVLVLDAYSGDSVPLHLLSMEAVALLKKCVKPDGIVIFHVSNRFLNVARVLGVNAEHLGAHVLIGTNNSDNESLSAKSIYLIASWDKAVLDTVASLDGPDWIDFKAKKAIVPWTDTYSNPLAVLDMEHLVSQLTEFKPFRW